jgi:hypothetical protein
MHRHAIRESANGPKAGQIKAKVPLTGTGVLRFFASGLIFSADAMMWPPLPAYAHKMPKPRAILIVHWKKNVVLLFCVCLVTPPEGTSNLKSTLTLKTTDTTLVSVEL